MLEVTVRRPIAPADTDLLRRLDDAAARADGHVSLGESVWRDLAHPTGSSFLAVARARGEVVGALHAAPPENEAADTLTMALVVDPRHRGDDAEHCLLDTVLADPRVQRHRALLWVFGAGERSDRLAAATGFVPERELRQMRVLLPAPVDAPLPDAPPGVEMRAFRVGTDEPGWLAVNNRAFAHDPDQRDWTLEMLRRREHAPWFDPDGFRMAWRGGALAGFCWTRLHPPAPPLEPETLGEIYVIGVDPDHQGTGLGRALVVEGLAWLHAHGATVGMLFVDAANAAAVALYEALGFATHRVDRAYVRQPS